MEKLSNYTFHYSSHTNFWAAIPRGNEKVYWNEDRERCKADGIIYATEFDILIDFLTGNFK